MTLKELQIGKYAKVIAVRGKGSNRQHILDMGIIPGIVIKVVKYAPMGDPIEILVHGYLLALLKADAELIDIDANVDQKDVDSWYAEVLDANKGYNVSLHDHNSHPGLGEDESIYRSSRCRREHHDNELPKDTKLTFALAGQQNCGKSTLFNQLTGANQHVGNFPGVTVDRKDGVIKGHPETLVTDLPGIYSLSPYTAEEIVSREFILEQKPKGLINIIDAGNIERSLYLTMQLMELDVPMVLALNMMDEVRNNGGSIRVNQLEQLLGIPVVPISASKNEGVDELVDHALHVARYQEAPLPQDFCDKDEGNGAVHRCLHGIMHLIEDHAQRAGLPMRFCASKLVEGDELIMKKLNFSPREAELVEEIIVQMEKESGLDRAAAIADMRYAFIRKICSQTVVKPRESKEYRRSRNIDKVLTGKWTAIPIFIVIMSAIIWLSIEGLGAPLQDWLDQGVQWVAHQCDNLMTNWGVNNAIRSLIVEGVFGGVGGVLSFIPIIILLFFFLSILEDSGYMARIAFVTDKLLRRIGLTGRSIVPLLIGFGCSVPAVMATRTLPSERDRRRTIFLTPYMSCSAKIPVFLFFTQVIFPEHTGLVVVALYLLGIIIGVLIAILAKLFGKHSEAAPFVMELPNYRMPGVKNVGHLLWDKTRDFLVRAFTIIFLACLIIWVLQTYDFRFNMVENGEGSMLAIIAGFIAPIFNPIGLGHWQLVTALITGFIAKESVIATVGVLGVESIITPAIGVSMLIFSLLYTPCVATIASIRREQGPAMAIGIALFQCVLAYIFAFIAYHIALLCF